MEKIDPPVLIAPPLSWRAKAAIAFLWLGLSVLFSMAGEKLVGGGWVGWVMNVVGGLFGVGMGMAGTGAALILREGSYRKKRVVEIMENSPENGAADE